MTDIDIVQKVSKILQNKKKLTSSLTRKTLTLNITSPYLFSDLNALGCIPNKTRYATYPQIADDLDRHLIRGIMDGDGSWVIRKNRMISLQICGNNLLMYGIYSKILLHLGISPQSVQYPIEHDPRIKMETFCLIKYNTTDSLTIRNWIYEAAEIYGTRKLQKAYSYEVPYTDRFTTRDLAAYLGVDQTFVKRNVSKHSLPHRRIGPYYYFDKEDMAAWVDFLRTRLRDIKCKFPNRGELINKWLSDKGAPMPLPGGLTPKPLN
jgi:excisionase family DNA binding protein